jgi:hypothetical protein
VGWKSEGYKELCACVCLIECDKTFPWHKVNTEEYYQRYTNQFGIYTGPIKDTWLTHDGAVLTTKLELYFTQRNDVLNITISEGISDDHTKRPVWINPER